MKQANKKSLVPFKCIYFYESQKILNAYNESGTDLEMRMHKSP